MLLSEIDIDPNKEVIDRLVDNVVLPKIYEYYRKHSGLTAQFKDPILSKYSKKEVKILKNDLLVINQLLSELNNIALSQQVYDMLDELLDYFTQKIY